MVSINLHLLTILLVVLVLLSAFFSSAETGMMAINRYRLRHLARKGNIRAKRTVKLLKRPDRLLGVILIGNTFANILAASLATIIAVHYFGQLGVILATIFLTFIILIFGETAPKTFAAIHPRRAAFAASLPLQVLLFIFYPFVWLINAIANSLLRLFGVHINGRVTDTLTSDELRTVVREATSKVSSSYQQMLLRIFNLGQMTVEDIMIPRNAIHGIDITDPWDKIVVQLTTCEHAYMPLYRESIDHIIGMLTMRQVMVEFTKGDLSKDKLMKFATDVYFIPEVTLLHHQILNFQRESKVVSLVVDEYGDIQGLATLQDILEEIVGEVSADLDITARLVQKQNDGSYLVDGRISVRDLNRITDWKLPIEGPRTLSGLIIEYLETIPATGLALRLAGYPMEIMKMSGNTVRSVRVWPNKWLMNPPKTTAEV